MRLLYPKSVLVCSRRANANNALKALDGICTQPEENWNKSSSAHRCCWAQSSQSVSHSLHSTTKAGCGMDTPLDSAVLLVFCCWWVKTGRPVYWLTFLFKKRANSEKEKKIFVKLMKRMYACTLGVIFSSGTDQGFPFGFCLPFTKQYFNFWS